MKARLVEWRDLAPDARHFIFEVPGVDEFVYEPGQFMLLALHVDGQTISSPYSIAGPPEGNRFELCLNHIPDGKFSPHLFALSPGDEIEARGPAGTMIWQRNRDVILVATGSGIAPFRSILRHRLPIDRQHQYTLIYGTRFEHELFYGDEFQAMARDYPNFHFKPTVTRPSETWTGATGRIQPNLSEAVGNRGDLDVYVCGPPDLVNDVRALLEGKGFESDQIIFERARLPEL